MIHSKTWHDIHMDATAALAPNKFYCSNSECLTETHSRGYSACCNEPIVNGWTLAALANMD